MESIVTEMERNLGNILLNMIYLGKKFRVKILIFREKLLMVRETVLYVAKNVHIKGKSIYI